MVHADMQAACEQLTSGKLYFWGDLFDPATFPVNETGMRLWTLVVFSSLLQSNISASIIHDELQSGSQFAMSVILTGVLLHCTYKILSYWSGATWNWGSLWVYLVLIAAQFVYSYINTSPVVGDFSLTTQGSDLSAGQIAILSVAGSVVLVWLAFNVKNLSLPGNSARLFAWFQDTRKFARLIWLAAVIAVFAVHTLPRNNGAQQVWHFHHALCGWFLFCVAILFGTPTSLQLAQQCIACAQIDDDTRTKLCNFVCECTGTCAKNTLCCKCGVPGKPCTRCTSERTDLADPNWSPTEVNRIWTTKGKALQRKSSIPSAMNVANQLFATVFMAVLINGSVTYGVGDFELIQNSAGGELSAAWRRAILCIFSALIVAHKAYFALTRASTRQESGQVELTDRSQRKSLETLRL